MLYQALSQEAAAEAHELLAGLEPKPRRLANEQSLPGDRWRSERTSKLTADRPSLRPWRTLDELICAEEQRWVREPHLFLEGRTPLDASRDEDRQLYELFEVLARHQVSGRTPRVLTDAFDLDRVRASLGIGARAAASGHDHDYLW